MPTGSHYSSHWGIYVGLLLPRFIKELHINMVSAELFCRKHYYSSLQHRVKCRTLFSHLSSLGHDNLESSLLCPRKKRNSWSEFSICHSLQCFLNLKLSPQIKLKGVFWKQWLQGVGSLEKLPPHQSPTVSSKPFRIAVTWMHGTLWAYKTDTMQRENMLKHLIE